MALFCIWNSVFGAEANHPLCQNGIVEQAGWLHGVRLFNDGRVFDAHEVWEDVWRPLPVSPERTFVQGLIQIAVAFHHNTTGNRVGAASLLKRGLRNVEACGRNPWNIELGDFLRQVKSSQDALSGGKKLVESPKISLREHSEPGTAVRT
jgi:predicted metal-dependent hydrolase